MSAAEQSIAVGRDAVPLRVVEADDPVAPKSGAWLRRFAVLWFGLWMANLVPLQLLLPDRLEELDRVHKVRDFGVVNGVAGAAALVALPVLGALCDRTRSRHGRRRVWAAAGLLLMCAGLLLMGVAGSVVALGGGWLVAMVGMSVAMTGLTAAIADGVPETQRGTASGAMYGPQAPAALVGMVLLSALGGPHVAGYAFLAVIVGVCAAPFLRLHRDVSAPPSLRSGGARLLDGFWLDAARHRDFAWALGARLLFVLGNALATCYLLYFLTDGLRLADPETALVELTAVYLAATLSVTWLGGVASDRSARRRIFVGIGALLQAVAAGSLVIAPSLTTAFAAALLLGAGFGAFLAVDQAIITMVLPDAASRAKDLGIINIGYLAPQAVGPLLASVLIGALGGYRTLFAAAAGTTIGAASAAYRVRVLR